MIRTLFVRPSHDDVTSYLHYFSRELVQESKSRGFNTIDKEKENSTRKIVTEVIKKNEPKFIMFNGHGDDSLICGHRDEIIIEYNDNHALLKNKIIYSLSCSSAKELGRGVSDNNTTFIGYVDDFALGMDTNCQASINKDKMARLFLEPSNLLVKSILKGNCASEAIKKAKDLMKKNISFLRTESSPDAKDYLPFIFNNYLVLEVLGNKTAALK